MHPVRSRRWRVGAVIAVAVATLATLAGCTAVPTRVVADSSVTIAVMQEYTGSVGPDSTLVDSAVVAATLSGFSVIEASGRVRPDETFGTMTKLSDDPLIVQYTTLDGLHWSDGAPIDAVDLLLDWAARSGVFPAFDVEGEVLPKASAMPEVSADRKSLTVTFDEPTARWEEAFRSPMPAHHVAGEALGVEDPDAAGDAVIAAVRDALAGDSATLDAIAEAWNTAWMPDSDGQVILPSSGPYSVESIVPGEVTLVANSLYAGGRRPYFERVVLLSFDNAFAAAQALQARIVAAIQVDASPPVWDSLAAIRADFEQITSRSGLSQLVAWYARELDGVDPSRLPAGLAWNLWEWSPKVRLPGQSAG